MAHKYKIKHFYDITNRSDFRANPDYKGVCHIAMAQEGLCIPGMRCLLLLACCLCVQGLLRALATHALHVQRVAAAAC